ncbi:hypothetical protein N7489_004787 [Penicillium chrysogenum]|uniref:Uncharacterized protein n=1 Tax=Penicillium chrysogenum TaxID=5076 RepID=A0ABQ8WDC2_PENCH|nr:uncharacterized protein N7489_004787 [Penicillium chrysogenum]KAJ5244691.1 hypothetical protein N7489_004787 [Penicillium chrysogenum]KAJ5264605.1 hypothetical protein N7505_007398 [Penicillium chrysogenum]KAJ5849376.1 hypothetical protein N7534_008065 [Penicillium rubens]
MCQLHPLPEAIEFDRWIAETEDQKPKRYNPYNINFDRPDQMSEQAIHELKEYEHSFDQTRWLKMQATQAKFNLPRLVLDDTGRGAALAGHAAVGREAILVVWVPLLGANMFASNILLCQVSPGGLPPIAVA